VRVIIKFGRVKVTMRVKITLCVYKSHSLVSCQNHSKSLEITLVLVECVVSVVITFVRVKVTMRVKITLVSVIVTLIPVKITLCL
jgi:hypothetical protein